MQPSDTCGYCGRAGHYDDQCPRRPRIEMLDEPAPVTWHKRPLGSLAADIDGKVLGRVTNLERGETWSASIGERYLGEYVTEEMAQRAVELAAAAQQ